MLYAVEHLDLRDLADSGAPLRTETGRPRPALVVVDLDDSDWTQAAAIAERLAGGRHPVLVGVATGSLPDEAAPVLAQLTCTLAPGGPGRAWVVPEPGDLDRIGEIVAAAPRAAVALAGLLPLTAVLEVPEGLVAESLAYSMLLAGEEFRGWRTRTPRGTVPDVAEPVLLARKDDVLTVELNRPERHNAFGRAVRDGLIAGLEVAELDPSVLEVVVRARGRSFCSGGDLDEFGSVSDPAQGHLLRLQLSAGLAVHRLGSRIRFQVHGACIGAGAELPAFAPRVVADRGAFFQLPELAMGLVPGAGGTVSITRRVGRWRTAYMALTNRRLDATTALNWGLVDGLG